jgi:hypothetical protein
MSNNTATSGTTSFLWDFHFNLNYECSFEDIHGPPGITLKSRVHDDGKTKIVSGFTVRVNSPTEEDAKDIAEKQAKILVDILAVLSTTPLEYTLTGFEMYRPEGGNAIISSLTSSYLKFGIGRPTDLNKGNYRKLIQTPQPKGNDQDLAHAVSSANAGLKAEGYKLYEVMVRDYYLVIEKAVKNGKLNQGAKYKHLRDSLSHSGILQKDTKDGLTDTNNFPQDYFDLTPYGEFDHTSNKNRQHVKDEAINLKQIGLNYLKAEL